MTPLLVTLLLGLFAYGLYIAAVGARSARGSEEFFDAGRDLPGWTFIFAGTGALVAGLGLPEHLLLVRLYGLQASHVAIGLILAALAGALVQKRLWLAARLVGTVSPVELLGRYYDSTGLRVLLLILVMLFAVPVSATAAARMGGLVEEVTGGAIPAAAAIWSTLFFLFLAGVVGGWRAIVYAIAAEAVLLAVLFILVAGLSALAFDRLAMLASGIAVPAGTVADQIPGVIQFSRGIGKDVAIGGIWTTVAIVSTGLSLVGLVLNPVFGLLSNTTQGRTGLAFGQVWTTAGVATGLLVLLAPVIAAETALGPAGAVPSLATLVERLASWDLMAGLSLVLLLVVAQLVAIAFLTGGGSLLLSTDLVARDLLPGLAGRQRVLAARITMAVAYALVGLLATFGPVAAAILGSVAVSLSAQLLPAYLGLCFVPWLSRGAVLSGLVVGAILVVFTEPAGLVFFEGLFIDLPWGRWPLTIHSAAWGFVFNAAITLLVAIFTRGGEERLHRDRLHDVYRRSFRVDFGGPAGRGARWSLTLIWAFLALGPGAVLGNSFFSRPIFTEGEAALGLPSLWVWQVVSWLVGVILVWWLAYQTRLSVLDAPVTRSLDMAPPGPAVGPRRPPRWLAQTLARLTER